MFDDFAERLAVVRDRIAAAARRVGRDPAEVTLVAVTKGHPVDAMLVARAHGVTDLGESRVQDALPKLVSLDPGARVHFIGALQTNKVNKVVGHFASIMTVDREELLERIARRATELGVVQPVWIQVNASGEPQKGGCTEDQTAALWQRAHDEPALLAVGLMTMARYEAEEPELRRTFTTLRELARILPVAKGRTHVELSMGMSDDFEVAVEEGATYVRVGTSLFGARAGGGDAPAALR